MQINVDQVNAARANVQRVDVGHLGLGPISVRELVLTSAEFGVSATAAVLSDVRITVTIRIGVEWHVHVGLPDGIPDIDVGDTFDLGSLEFSTGIGDLTVPGLRDVRLSIPTLTAHNVGAAIAPVPAQIGNVTAEGISLREAAVPSSGFTVSGIGLNSASVNGVAVPAIALGSGAVSRVRADPVKLPQLDLSTLTVGTIEIPSASTAAAFDLPIDLQTRAAGFDAGLLRLSVSLRPSVVSHVEHLTLNGATATATAGTVVLHDVTLPFELAEVTLSQLGIEILEVPTVTLA